MEELANPEDAFKSSSSRSQSVTYNNIPGEKKKSPAENCKAVLERHGSEGVKSEGKVLRGKLEGASTGGFGILESWKTA